MTFGGPAKPRPFTFVQVTATSYQEIRSCGQRSPHGPHTWEIDVDYMVPVERFLCTPTSEGPDIMETYDFMSNGEADGAHPFHVGCAPGGAIPAWAWAWDKDTVCEGCGLPLEDLTPPHPRATVTP